MTRSPDAKAWDGIVRSTLGEHGWKITAGGHGTRRTPSSALSAWIRHDRRSGQLYGRVGITPRAFEAVARQLEQATGLPRRTVYDVPLTLVSGDGFVVAAGDDLTAAASTVADELQRQSEELETRFATLDDYETHLDQGNRRRENRLVWNLARDDTAAALELARTWIESSDHTRNDFRRPSARSLPLHVIEWLDPVLVTHAISGPSWRECSPLQVPWADVPTVLADTIRPGTRKRTEAFIVWAVPDGESFSPSMAAPATPYIQTVGEGDEWTVEVNQVDDGRVRNIVLGRSGGDPDPAAPAIEIPWQKTSFAIRAHECFTPDEVLGLLAVWVERGDVDPSWSRRPLAVP